MSPAICLELVGDGDSEKSHASYLVNPLRGEVLELLGSDVEVPTYNKFCVRNDDRHGMGFDDVTSTYKIVHISGNTPRRNTMVEYAGSNHIAAQVYAMGTRSWRTIQSVPLLFQQQECIRGWLVKGRERET